ncbi:MAG: ribosome small subunit-dependent GTPase A [Gallionella sp.]|nr:ribosome small subunit-dependent GTPase A [Gallionella sp.]
MATLHAQIVAAFGRQYLAKLPDGEMLTCLTRGKRSDVVCGDHVEVQRTGDASSGLSLGALNIGQAVIDKVSPRTSLLFRSDAFKQKLIAANVTQIVIVVATEPSFSDELLARCLVAAYDQNLEVLIVLNKCDLGADAARAQLANYRAIGYRVLELSALEDVSALRALLDGHVSVLVGQSGMGKSTLINGLLPDAQAATREISTVLDSGKHTTTHAKLYRLNERSSVIDCPGVQAFGLHHLTFGAIEQGFTEFSPYLGKCRFRDCRHLKEPDCALRIAVSKGEITARRLELFLQIAANKA